MLEAFVVPIIRIWPPEDTSQSRTEPSLDAESTLRPREMIAVEVTARECPFNVLAGVTRVGVSLSCPDVAGSAETMDSAKSTPAVRSTREEGKNCTEVTALK